MARTVFNREQPEVGEGAETSLRKWSPRELWTPVMILLIALLIVKLLLFALLWCSETSSWGALSDIRLYAHTILLTFILSIPIGMFRCRWLQLAIHLATDIWCICLLSQGGGSLTRLPVVSWLLTNALPKMGLGGTDSLPWLCVLLPLTTLLSLAVCLKHREQAAVPVQGKMQYGGYLLAWSLITALLYIIYR